MTKPLLMKTLVATLVLGATTLSTPAPASAGDRCRGGAIVDGASYAGNDYASIDAAGCSEMYFEQTRGGNNLNGRMRDYARAMSTQTGNSRTNIDGSGDARIGTTNRNGVSHLEASERGQIASYNKGGVNYLTARGRGTIESDNCGGVVRAHTDGGTVVIKVR